MKRSDSGWLKRYSNYRSTIQDFERSINYGRELSTEELASEIETLNKDKPGYTPIIARHTGGGVYLFFTTWDSSD